MDRNNVLEQTRVLLGEKSRAGDLDEMNKKISTENEGLVKHAQELQKEFDAFQGKLEAAESANAELQKKYTELSKTYVAIDRENEQLGRALADKIDKDPEFQKMLSRTAEVKKENTRLANELKKTEQDRQKAYKQALSFDNKAKKAISDSRNLYKKIAKLEKEKTEIIGHNKKLAKEANRAPQRFRNMAQENKMLIRETSDMHYNLGVFFSQSRHYDRAIKEFERALDINPNNAKVHYNLGYLYAEEFKRHDEALNHFQKFLDLDPRAKESEEVRKYLLVQQTYGASPMTEKTKGKPAKF